MSIVSTNPENIDNIIGFPTETKEDVLETINLNYLSKPNYSTMSFFQPWEGTSLKKSSIAEGYLDKDYSESGYSPGQQGDSILNLNTITNSELKHYHDYFSYYIIIQLFQTFLQPSFLLAD